MTKIGLQQTSGEFVSNSARSLAVAVYFLLVVLTGGAGVGAGGTCRVETKEFFTTNRGKMMS